MARKILFLCMCLITASLSAPTQSIHKEHDYSVYKPKRGKSTFVSQEQFEKEAEKLRKKTASQSKSSGKKLSWWKALIVVVVAVIVTVIVTTIVVISQMAFNPFPV